jgi:hypothetical protein
MLRNYFNFEKELFDESLDQPDASHYHNFEDAQYCLEIISISKRLVQNDASFWASSLTPWNDLVEAIRQRWGERWICFHLANIAGGIKSSTETYADYSDLLDYSKDLCKRVRYARLRAGNYSWWANQLECSNNEIDKAISLMILTTWAGTKTLVKIIPKLDKIITFLSDSTWKNVYNSVEVALNLQRNWMIDLNYDQIGHFLNPRTVALLSLRANNNTRKLLYSNYLRKYEGSDELILKSCYNMSLGLLSKDYSAWDEVRDVIQRSYAKGVVFEPFTYQRYNRHIASRNIPEDIAMEIVSKPNSYPGFLVAIAEMKIKEKVASAIIPVGQIAIRDKWFEHL